MENGDKSDQYILKGTDTHQGHTYQLTLTSCADIHISHTWGTGTYTSGTAE